MKTVKTCPECGVDFTPAHPSSKYDKAECRDKARRRSNRMTPVQPDEAAALSIERKMLAAEAKAATADRIAKAARLEVSRLEEELAMTRHELTLYTDMPQRRPDWLKSKKASKEHRGTLVAFLSDVHAGEVVKPEEMDGYNAYDLDICEQRLKRFFERTMTVSRNYLAGVKYDGIVLGLGGDMVSGDIHEELIQTNEVSTYESVEFLVPLLVAGIEAFAEEFGKVHIVSAPGNHGRDSKKPRSKRRSAHNADTHTSRLVAQHFRDSTDITFEVPATFDVGFSVYDYSFSMEHGDNMKFSGVSEVGSIGPVKRGTLRKSRQAQSEGKPFDYNLVGHFHQFVPAYTQGFVMNGSLKGYDEYARTWHLTPEPAQQALMVVTPEHGITVTAPVLVQKRSTEGW